MASRALQALFAVLLMLVGCTSDDHNPFGGSSRNDSADSGDSKPGETGLDTNPPDSAPETGESDTNDTGTPAVTTGPIVRPTGIENFVIAVLDTTRGDKSEDPAVMPFVSEKNQDGVFFQFNWGSTNWTRPADPAIVTGVPGSNLGSDTFDDDSVPQIPDEVPTLGERFAEAGYATRADLCNQVAANSEADRGFDSVDVCEHPEMNDVTALEQFERSAEWIKEQDGPWVVFVQVMESHDPWNRPADECADSTKELTSQCPGWTGISEGFKWDEEYDAQCKAAIEAAYDCDTLQLDHDLRDGFALLEAEGLLEKTLVVITADHGENFKEDHGTVNGEAMQTWLAHHGTMYAQVSKVTGAMWWPGVTPTTVDFPTGHPDILPTVLDIAGLEYEDGVIEGESIFDLSENEEAKNRIITQFACDDGGSWNGAAYQVDGVSYHTVYKREKNTGKQTWATYNAGSDPDETTPLEDFDIPEEVKSVLSDQAENAVDWPCG